MTIATQLAILAEHEDRTGHKAVARMPFTGCNVCLQLSVMLAQMERESARALRDPREVAAPVRFDPQEPSRYD